MAKLYKQNQAEATLSLIKNLTNVNVSTKKWWELKSSTSFFR